MGDLGVTVPWIGDIYSIRKVIDCAVNTILKKKRRGHRLHPKAAQTDGQAAQFALVA